MLRKVLGLLLCFGVVMLFSPVPHDFAVSADAPAKCGCGPNCKCEHCATGKGDCKCMMGGTGCKCGAMGKCGCGPNCKCEHCAAGKGACQCMKHEMGCKCGCKMGAGGMSGDKNMAGQAPSTAHFSVAYTTDPSVIPVNAFHTWTITVTDADGKPVNDAEISVDGGMPAHGHGLPTQPQVTKKLGDGKYLVEGMKFSMPGEWEMKFTIKAGGMEETVVRTVEVQ
jgi:hypothetical protein